MITRLIEQLRRLWKARDEPHNRPDPTLWARVEADLPFLDRLTGAERRRLRELALRFLAEKEFHGANGFQLNDEILLSIALQACLPILNIGLDAYHGWIGVVVYSGDFIIPRTETDEAGVVHEYDDVVLGEAWSNGPVLVSWHTDTPTNEHINVVIHEFAHKLDMVNGEADGFPALPSDMSRGEWGRTFEHAYATLCEQLDAGEPVALDPYAAEHPAEFFAVACEAFFDAPEQLRAAFPDVYAQLRRYFRQDPAAARPADTPEKRATEHTAAKHVKPT